MGELRGERQADVTWSELAEERLERMKLAVERANEAVERQERISNLSLRNQKTLRLGG